jgi:ADP-ribosylglycohydrolase
MGKIVLGRKEYRDKVYACWLGKNIGGTIGAPYECKKYVNNITFFDPVPKEPAPNDDLDLQIVWLKMLEDKGVPPRLPSFAEYWQKYCAAYPWNEYGLCMRNMERGLMPPVSGWFENYYVDEMGSPIRSEIWACVCPADPQRAAAMAWMDSAVDHAGGEGTYGEMFWAAVESAAFVIQDPIELIRIGLAMVPPACSIARVIREAVWCRQNGKNWSESRERIATIYGHIQPCNAIPNHGFIILGWLYGKDFGDKLCKAVNCGYDTDCTGATLGSLLGIIGGTAYIPKQWSDPVGKTIKLHKFTGKFNSPPTLEELTDRTVALAAGFVAKRSKTVAFGAKTRVPADVCSILHRTEEGAAALRQDVRSAVAAVGDLDIVLHYNGDPVLYPGVTRRLDVCCRENGAAAEGKVSLEAPRGWKVRGAGKGAFDVTAGEVQGRNSIGVQVRSAGRTYAANFTVLGPDAAKGFPSATNIEYCPTCRGRKGTCVCPRT